MTPASAQKLQELLRQKIKANGPMNFADYMELALYHPEFGYYSLNEQTEDYYTNVDVHPIFGKILAQYFYALWKEKFVPGETFTLVECGAGPGKLAKHVLDECLRWGDFYANIEYVGVERSAARRKKAAESLASHGARARQAERFDFADGSLRGAIFSNELFDALPVRRVAKQNGKIREFFIDAELREILAEPSREVRDFFQWLGAEPVEGCKAEAQLAAREVSAAFAKALGKGAILTIDYGYEAKELYLEHRSEGTLLCHWRHQTDRNFLETPGLKDLTAHANFTVIAQESEAYGIKNERLRTQSQFLLDNGLEKIIEEMQAAQNPISRFKTSAAIKSLIHPEGMGGTFKVLLQTK